MADKYINTTEYSEEDKARMKWAREVLHTLEHIGAMEHSLKGEHIKAIRIAQFALDELTNDQRLIKEILNKQLAEAQRPLYDTAFHRGKRAALEEALESIDVINKSYVKGDKPTKG